MLVVSKASVPKKTKIVTTTTRTQPSSVTVVSTTKKRRRRARSNPIPRGLSSLSNCFLKCIEDPFNNPPCRAGFGTMVPTQLHTAYYRGTIVTSADANAGCLALFAFPNQNNLLAATYNSIGSLATPGTSTLIAAANSTILNGMFDQSRTVGMAMRLYPMIPATAVPGVISLGCAPRSDLGDLMAPTVTSALGTGLMNSSIQSVQYLPYLREHIARPSAADFFQVAWRPTDIKDFEFTPGDTGIIGRVTSGAFSPFYDINAAATSSTGRQDDTQGSFLVATCQGMPASTAIYVEVVVHFETTATSKLAANTEFAASRPAVDSVAAEGLFPSMESFYRSIAPHLPNVDTVVGTASSVLSSPIVRTAATRYVRSFMGVRSSGFELLQ